MTIPEVDRPASAREIHPRRLGAGRSVKEQGCRLEEKLDAAVRPRLSFHPARGNPHVEATDSSDFKRLVQASPMTLTPSEHRQYEQGGPRRASVDGWILPEKEALSGFKGSLRWLARTFFLAEESLMCVARSLRPGKGTTRRAEELARWSKEVVEDLEGTLGRIEKASKWLKESAWRVEESSKWVEGSSKWVKESSQRVKGSSQRVKEDVTRLKEATIESKEAGTPSTMAAASPINVSWPSSMEIE